MKILVTGGAGYIGSHTCKALAQAGHTVIVYDNLSTGHRAFVLWGDFEHGDIRETEKLRACLRRHQPDGVIHFAASAYVGESVENPGKYFRNNVEGTLSILEAMRDEGVHNIVVSGTCAVYGEPDVVPISESCRPSPINPYGASKLFMERMLADFEVAHGMQWVCLRYFNAAGSSPQAEIGELHTPETHLIPRVMMAALGKVAAINIFGTDYDTPDGTCIRDYIHVDDLADAHVLAAAYLVNGGKSIPLNLGTENGFSVREIVHGTGKVSGKSIVCREVARRAGDPACLIADATKAKAVLGWSANASLEKMLTDAWNYLSVHLNK